MVTRLWHQGPVSVKALVQSVENKLLVMECCRHFTASVRKGLPQIAPHVPTTLGARETLDEGSCHRKCGGSREAICRAIVAEVVDKMGLEY